MINTILQELSLIITRCLELEGFYVFMFLPVFFIVRRNRQSSIYQSTILNEASYSRLQ
jgi:hypothetical protein